MGNFYVNISVKSGDRDAILSALPIAQDPGVIGPSENGWTVLSSAALDTQDHSVIETYCAALSAKVGVPVLGALNHDDDILMLFLYRDGGEAGHFNSSPGGFSRIDQPRS